MTAARLLAVLRSGGLTVKEDPGWQTRGVPWSTGKPVGIMEHHTALPVPFPVNRLNGSSDSRIKCNINTKPDGTVWMVAYNACNYSSGRGSSVVLSQSLRGESPTANASDRNLTDTTNGNPFYWNFENDHRGDGSPIPDVQLRAIAIATEVVAEYWGLSVNNVISHAEWTKRKSDPYWNGNRRCIEELRDLIRNLDLSAMTELQARLEIATGVHSRRGIWMEGAGEGPQERLTRLAKSVANGERSVAEILSHFGDPQPNQPNDPVPAWVLDPMVAFSPVAGEHPVDLDALATAVANDLQIVPKT